MPIAHSCRALSRCFSLLLISLLCLGAAWADTGDRFQPLNAEADNLRYEAASQTSIFSGNVVITKGSILIRAARVEVKQDEQGHHRGIITGTPAFFRQKRTGSEEFVEGQALRIEYDSRADTVQFTGNAVLRRYTGSQVNDETSGGLIVYNNSNDTFSVDGGTAHRTADNPSGRVRAMLTPTPKAAGQAPDATPAPLPLRPSGQTGIGKP